MRGYLERLVLQTNDGATNGVYGDTFADLPEITASSYVGERVSVVVGGVKSTF